MGLTVLEGRQSCIVYTHACLATMRSPTHYCVSIKAAWGMVWYPAHTPLSRLSLPSVTKIVRHYQSPSFPQPHSNPKSSGNARRFFLFQSTDRGASEDRLDWREEKDLIDRIGRPVLMYRNCVSGMMPFVLGSSHALHKSRGRRCESPGSLLVVTIACILSKSCHVLSRG